MSYRLTEYLEAVYMKKSDIYGFFTNFGMRGIERVLKGEETIDAISGTIDISMNGKKHKKVLGALALTPTRVILYHNKMSFMGHFSMDYPLQRINNVVFNVGIFWAEIRIHSGDDVLLIERLPIDEGTENFVKNLKTMIYEANNKGSNVPNYKSSQASFIDIADQIQKLANLKTQGVLTEKEFSAQKKKLLES